MRTCAIAANGVTGRWPLWGLVGVTVILLGGCAFSQDPEPTFRADEEELPILWSDSGTFSRLARHVKLAVRDRDVLAQLPLTDVPVDFDKEMVLIVGLGPTASGVCGVRITRVWRRSSVIRVQTKQIHPGSGDVAGASVASPWAICIVPRSDLNVEGFETRVPKGLLEP